MQRVNIPIDPLTGLQKQYGFVDVGTKEMADYCKAVLSGVELYGKQIAVQDSRADAGQGVFTQKVLRVAFTRPPSCADSGTWPADASAGLPDGLLEKLRVILGRFGTVTGQVCHDGYALYSFSADEAVDEAARALDSQFVCGVLLETSAISR